MPIIIEFIIECALAACGRLFGIPVPREIERAFLVASMSTEEALRRIPVPCTVIEIEQAYIDWPGNEEVRIRKRTRAGSTRYYRTHKAAILEMQRLQMESMQAIAKQGGVATLDEIDDAAATASVVCNSCKQEIEGKLADHSC